MNQVGCDLNADNANNPKHRESAFGLRRDFLAEDRGHAAVVFQHARRGEDIVGVSTGLTRPP